MIQHQNIPAEKFFYAADGKVIKSINELPEALRNMSDDTFKHHVNAEKNDFYNWVTGVFNNTKVARKIKTAKTRETMTKKIFTEVHS